MFETPSSLAGAKWTKVNESGHSVRAAANSCSFVSVLQKDVITRKARVFSSQATIEESHSPQPLIFLYPFCLFSSCFLFLSPSRCLCPAIPLSSVLFLSSVFLKHTGKGEINGVLGEGITQLNFDEKRRKKEERRRRRGREGGRIVYPLKKSGRNV